MSYDHLVRWEASRLNRQARCSIPWQAEWKFLDDGSDQGTAWKERALDDRLWKKGSAPLGYSSGGIPLGYYPSGLVATQISYGTNAPQKHVTTYFRKEFALDAPNPTKPLLLRLETGDDGVVAYLNGSRILRGNDDKYCSESCYNKDHYSCAHCGEPFDPDESDYGDYCSESCYDEANEDEEEEESVCYNCEAPIQGEAKYVDRDGDVYCSAACKRKVVPAHLTDDELEELEAEDARKLCRWCGESYDQRLTLADNPNYCCAGCEEESRR